MFTWVRVRDGGLTCHTNEIGCEWEVRREGYREGSRKGGKVGRKKGIEG